MVYDLIIIGGGPAGMSAGIYASRKKLKTLLITDSLGGQSFIASDIQNFIGFKSISGIELTKKIEEHLRAQKEIEIKDQTRVSKIKKDNNFIIETENNESFEAKTVLLALGSHYRKLNIPGEKEFEGKGVFYCSTCDAPLMKEKSVIIIGGGNTGFASARDLLSYASKVYILEYSESPKADPIEQERIISNKLEIITMAKVQEIFGETFVKGLKYQNRDTNEIKELKAEGIFISIGYEPNSEFLKDFVKLNNAKQVIVNCKTQETSLKGVWAAGDITDTLYHQNNTAIGDAIKAVLNIYDYLKKS
ncbi:FAD-dependent oxidoreductase [Candidatus Wolfebacteria bacterium]|nr:FAD-dependent oxidoreductase [Candidatus Wolfebacteria bacterium]